jgi:D-amino peptidase
MKWMVRVDMEGLTGVVNMNQVVPGANEYEFGKRMLMHDLNAVLEGLLQEASDEVWLYDIHFYGTNIELDDLDPRVTVICGKPNYTPKNLSYLDESFDGLILLGLHARAQMPGCVLNHNYEHDIRAIHVHNGQGQSYHVGEIGLEALIAGEAGVPLVMVTGDSAGCQESIELQADTVTVVVKESLGDTAAACYPPSRTRQRLIDGAIQSRTQVQKLKPLLLEGPVELEMFFYPGDLLNKLQMRLDHVFTSADRLVLKGNTVIEAWEKYLIAKA